MPTQIEGLAVIGCGHWGSNLIRNFNEIGVLKAVCDTDKAVAQRQAEQTGADRSDLDQILSRSDIDSVAIATPPATHASLAGAALRASKHVFVEKPMALDPKEGEMLCALAAETGRILMVGHLLQYHPAFQKLRELVRSGTLGRLRYVYSTRANLGQFRREENGFLAYFLRKPSSTLEDAQTGKLRIEAQILHSSKFQRFITTKTT